MANWERMQRVLRKEHMQQLYTDRFPIEVRHYLADWIEKHFTSDIHQFQTPEVPYEMVVRQLIENFIQEIENLSLSMGSDFVTKTKLDNAAQFFKMHQHDNYLSLYEHIRSVLAAEEQIFRMENGETHENSQFNNVEAMIGVQFQQLTATSNEINLDLKKLDSEQEKFTITYHDCTKVGAILSAFTTMQPTAATEQQKKEYVAKKEKMDIMLRNGIGQLLELRVNIIQKLTDVYAKVSELQTKILDDELIQWKREQQLYGNGGSFNNNKLDIIQQWSEHLADIIWGSRVQVKEFQRFKQQLDLNTEVSDNSAQLLADFTQLLSSLVTSTFIIEKQPPQVMKTNTRFTATVRLLVGGKLNVNMSPPHVRVTIISEAQANSMLRNERMYQNGDASGEILNNTGAMEYQQSTRQLSVSFRNMQLKKIKRAEKKGTESVMDEKFSLLFKSSFNIGNGELTFQVWTLSLPVVVIVHGNQEPHAWATVTWDNAFSEPGRAPFVVPDKVPWCHVAETLSLKFLAATQRRLDENHLKVLGEKAFRGITPDSTHMLTWAQFCKEPLPDRSFTFWEWFYAVMKLTREHLRGPWVDNAILGFIRKKTLEDMLKGSPYGTFALRFSDSELGGITIAWYTESGEVLNIQPFTAKDFSIRSLADRIADLENLRLLYPDRKKEEVFNKYYTDNQTLSTSNGYVKSTLRTTIDTAGGSLHNTPQHMTSPEYYRETPSVASGISVYSEATCTTDDTNMEDYYAILDSFDPFAVSQ